MVREEREPLEGVIQLDDTFVGAKTQDKSIALVAAEEGGRVRLVQAPGNHEACIEHVADTEISPEAAVKTDGHAAYSERTHDAKVQTKAERQANDHLQLCHWTSCTFRRIRPRSVGSWALIAVQSWKSTYSRISTSTPSVITGARRRASAALLRDVLRI